MRGIIISVSGTRGIGDDMLMVIVHDEPGRDKDVFIADAAEWILARSTEPVQGAKPKL